MDRRNSFGIFLALFCLFLGVRAAQLPITFGTAPNDGSGQTLRSAFGNAQTNFTELYGLTGSDSPFVLRAIGWSTNQSLTNALFGNAGLRPAFATKDSSFVFFSNSIITLTKNSTLAIGDGSGTAPSVTFDDGGYISDPAFGKLWNFKVSPTSNTVARLFEVTNSLIRAGANITFTYDGTGFTIAGGGGSGSSTGYVFDATQFLPSQISNIVIKSGALLTNLQSRGLVELAGIMNQGTENITGAAFIGGILTASNTVVGQAGENLTGALNVGGAMILTNTLAAQGAVQAQSTINITGASTHGGNAAFTNAVQVQGAATITGAAGIGGTLTATGAIVGASTENITGASFFGGVATHTNGIVGQSTENITGASFFGGILTASNTIVGQVGENLTGALGVGGTLTATGTVAHLSTVTNSAAVNGKRQTNWSDSISVAPLALLNSTNAFWFPTNAGDGLILESDAQGHGRWMPSTTNANTVYLAVNGNDSTAIRGNPNRPFLTWTNAINAIRNYDTLLIGPGTFNASGNKYYGSIADSNWAGATLFYKTNVTIIGTRGSVLSMTNLSDGLDVFACDGFTIRGTEWQCTRFPGTSTTNLGAVIHLRHGVRNTVIEGNRFLNVPDHTISDDVANDLPCTNTLIQANYAYNCGFTSGVPSLTIDGAFVAGCGSFLQVLNNTIDRCTRGVELENSIYSPALVNRDIAIIGNTITRCWVEPICSYAASAALSYSDVEIGNNIITDAEQVGYTTFGLHLNGANRFKVHNNHIQNIPDFGISAVADSVAHDVRDCAFTDNFIDTIGANVGLAISRSGAGTATNNIINGNQLKNVLTGIDYYGTGGTIMNNIVMGTPNQGVRIWSPGAFDSDNYIAFNKFYDTVNAVSVADGGRGNHIFWNSDIKSSSQGYVDTAAAGLNFWFDNVAEGTIVQGTNELGAIASYVNGQGGFASLTNSGLADFGGPASFESTVTNRSKSTTLAIQNIIMAGGHNTNALEIRQGPALVGAFNSNGVVTLQTSNSATIYPAVYTIAQQGGGFGSDTNLTTTTNGIWGPIQTGSLTLPPGFFTQNPKRTVSMDMSGDYWTGATPGACRFILSCGQDLTSGVCTPPLSQSGGRWEAHVDVNCWTNTTTGALNSDGYVRFYALGANTNVTAYLTNTTTIFDVISTNLVFNLKSTNGAATDSVLSRQGTLSLR